tara:strand:- start:314 stop:1462 length:1149 start_codon:yes stop_codon:yes gene_type:complete
MQLELERFFERAFNQIDRVPVPSSFSRARKKFKASAFVALNGIVQEVFTQHVNGDHNRTRWRGLCLKAADGSTLRLPNAPEVVNHFGGMQPAKGDFVPMARISFLYDVLTEVIVAGEITPYGVGEGLHVEQFLDEVSPNDCLILDRGYFDQLLPALICAKGAHFIMRVGLGQWNEAKDFAESGETERLVKLKVPLWVREEWKDEGVELANEIEARLVRVELSTNEVEILLTDLVDDEVYPAGEFDGIYHKRWGIEESYKTLKCKVEIENWSGRTPHAVEQDFQAAIVMMNIAQTLAFFKGPAVENQTSERGHAYKVNVKRTIAVVRDQLSALYEACDEKTERILRLIGDRITKALTLVRPGRSSPRKPRPPRIYADSYKPIS